MNIVTCIKRAIGSESELIIEDGKLIEDGLVKKINEWDNYAVQLAVDLKEKLDGKVTVITVGPDEAKEDLYLALAMGADEAIHIEYDREAYLCDPFEIASILSSVISKIDFDFVFTGLQSEDCNCSITGTILAELLDIPHVSAVIGVSKIQNREAIVHKELEGGLIGIVRVKLPALLAIQTGVVELKYVSFRAIKKAKQKKIKTINVEDLGLDINTIKKYKFIDIYKPVMERRAHIIEGRDDHEVVDKLISILEELGVV